MNAWLNLMHSKTPDDGSWLNVFIGNESCANSNSPGTADAPSLTIMVAVIPILLSPTLLSLGMPKALLEPCEFDDELLPKVH